MRLAEAQRLNQLFTVLGAGNDCSAEGVTVHCTSRAGIDMSVLRETPSLVADFMREAPVQSFPGQSSKAAESTPVVVNMGRLDFVFRRLGTPSQVFYDHIDANVAGPSMTEIILALKGLRSWRDLDFGAFVPETPA